jgi:hypothetical protein
VIFPLTVNICIHDPHYLDPLERVADLHKSHFVFPVKQGSCERAWMICRGSWREKEDKGAAASNGGGGGGGTLT